MKFVDSCEVDVVAGKGGNGSVAFRREKFVPFGGPSGGDGGRGGNVVFVADEGLSTLLDLTYGRVLRAENGEQGHGKDMYGRAGPDREVRVPVGTQIYDRESGELLYDIDSPGVRIVVGKGGKGGRGNIHFATPYDRAPRRAEPGEPGEEKKLRLELKVMADVGLLGFPNVGKSTFIRAVSRARPKVADYPFTTLTPHLGVVRIGDEASFVVADIPGLIPGAAEGAGLGHRFLKHMERTRALLHLVTLDYAEEREPLRDYDALMNELASFDPELAKRPQIVAVTKGDLSEVRDAFPALQASFAQRRIPVRLVSAATGEGMRELSIDLYKLSTGKSEVEDWERPTTPRLVDEVEPETEPVIEREPEGEIEPEAETVRVPMTMARPKPKAPAKKGKTKNKVATAAKAKPAAKKKAKPAAKKKPAAKPPAKKKAKPAAKKKPAVKPAAKKKAKPAAKPAVKKKKTAAKARTTSSGKKKAKPIARKKTATTRAKAPKKKGRTRGR